jgi:hypothetical protein
MQRLSALILVGLICFQTIGYLMIQLSRLGEARNAMTCIQTSGQATGNAETIVLTAHNLGQLAVGKKEIRYQGSLYDIVAQSDNADGTVTLQVLRDTPEQNILDAFSTWIGSARQSTQEHPVVAYMASLLTIAFILPEMPAILQAPEREWAQTCFYYGFSRGEAPVDGWAPPPDYPTPIPSPPGRGA